MCVDIHYQYIKKSGEIFDIDTATVAPWELQFSENAILQTNYESSASSEYQSLEGKLRR